MPETKGSYDDGWTIQIITPDERGIQFYLKEYKDIRLLSLRESPSSFGSTYEREIVFTENDWIQRVTNPHVTTFVAVASNDGRILSSASLMGPLPIQDDAKTTKIKHGTRLGVLHWDLAGVYTRPEARRTGLARELLRTSWEWAAGKASSQGSGCMVTAEVMGNNDRARGLYEAFGFSANGESDGRLQMVRFSEGTSGSNS